MPSQVLSKQFFVLIVATFLTLWSSSATGQGCQCPKIECGPCEVHAGLEFYTEPCDGGENRVRSCSKPRCRAVASASPACLAKQGRQPADDSPAPTLERIQIVIAEVADVRGQLVVHRESESGTRSISNVQKGFKLSAKDSVQTDDASKAKIVFRNGNLLIVGPLSKLEISDYRHNDKTREGSTLLNLTYGWIRNTIDHKNKYDNQSNNFEIKTKSAVAGVRGTDFVTEFDETKGDRTTIKTVSGMVALRSELTGEEHPVVRGYKLSVYNEGSGSARSAYFSMPQHLTESEVNSVEQVSLFDDLIAKKAPPTTDGKEKVARSPASIAVVCHNPQADYNQCQWQCRGGKKKAKTCETSQSGVQCVRSRCAASGSWVEETVLPGRFSTQCPPQGSRVDGCDY